MISTIVIIVSCIPLCSFPHLSDDVYRFHWDGILISLGHSPYAYLPNEVLSMSQTSSQLNELYPALNSKEYYSIYPVIDQFLFYLAVLCTKIGISFHIGLKCMYLILHLAGFILVMKTNRFSMPTLSLYYLNPLVIIEGIGNLHIEVVLVSFLALSLYFYEYHRLYLALLFYSLAIHTKLTPLMFLPFIFLYLLKIKNMKAITLLIFMIGIGFLPFALSHNATGFSSSLDLYFRKFEFNGGIYNLLKYIGSMVLGYNPIHIVGPLLSLIFFIYILYLVYKHNHIDLTHQSEAGWIELYSHWAGLTLFTHLLFSTTVHPWYLITVLFLTILWEVNLIVIWSYLITLTYIQYDGGVFQTNYWIIGLEYSILFLMMFKNQNFLNFLFKK